MRQDDLDHLHAVIMAGGKGTRFWPLSTRQRPKQLLRITGDRTMIQETAARLRPLVPPERLWVVTGADESGELVRQLPDVPREQILVEPVGRNTAPCIALAALHLLERDPRAAMAVLPADHSIADPEALRAALAAGCEAVTASPVLLTLGMSPTRPETGYGYIERGRETAAVGDLAFFEVSAFREKPDRETAAAFVDSGRYLWNTGIFMWTARVILEEIRRHLPDLAAAFESVQAAPKGGDRQAATARIYDRLEGVSIDYGVLERSERVWVLPCSFGWSDVGSWAALLDLRERDESGNAVQGEAVLIDAHDSLVLSDGRLVAAVGVENLVIVATGGAVLVCARDRAQDVRKVVEELDRRGRLDRL